MRDSSKATAESKSRREIFLAGVFAVLCFFVLFHNLGGAALFEPDEGRNAEVAREILLLQDWVTPHYDFIPYLDKPMFFYWLVALAYKVFGVSEWSARLSSALAALGCVALVYNLARTSLGIWGGLWSGLILSTSPVFMAFSRATIFDMTLTFFITLALWGFYRGINAEGKSRRIFFLAMYAAMGCATLAKGPIGAILPALVIASYLLLTRRWSILREIKPALGLGIFLLIVAPWYVCVELRNPGYLRYFLLEENFLRYLTPQFKRGQPWHYYIEVLAVGFFPWTALIYAPFMGIPAALKDERKLFLLLWVVLPFLFFSFSHAKQPGYILPIFPPLAVLTGDAVARMLGASSAKTRWPLSISWVILLAAFSYFTLALFVPELLPAKLQERSPEILPLIRQISGLLIPLLLALLALGVIASLRAKASTYYLVSCVFFATFHLFGLRVLGPISQTRSSRQLAEQTLPLLRPGDQMVIYDDYRSSLPFYLHADQPLWVVTREDKDYVMGSFYIAKKNPAPARGAGAAVLSFDEFSKIWGRSPSRLIVFVEQKRLSRFSAEVSVPPKKLLTVGDTVLVTNR
jgi:4-amino-4-deoxy-L-arabinose transferase-like glycosyltransferase